MLLIVAFITGAAVMAFEVLGFRVMAVTFGSLDIVNGSLIGAILTALSAGYYVGGIIADRFPKPGLLGVLIIIAGASIAIVPEISTVIYNSQLSNPEKTGRWGPLVGALILFAPASILLGMTSPFVIRLLAPAAHVLGRVSGRVYAISTMGSIFGTLLTTFYLMPAEWVAGHNNALRIVGGTSILTGFIPIVWGWLGRASRRSLTTTLLISILSLAIGQSAHARLVYKRDTTYHHIEVHDESFDRTTIRLLRFDNSEQSGLNIRDPDSPVWLYTDYVHLALVFQPQPRNALILGLGGGTIPKRMHRDYRQVTIDVAELDPVVRDVAKRFFFVKEDDRFRIHISDGRQYLRRTDQKYDVIVMDAYHGGRYGPSLPFTLCTREFFQIVSDRLNDDGVLAFNLIGQLKGSSKLTRSIIKTMDAVFPNTYIFPVDLKRYPGLATKRNIIVVCSKSQKRLSPSTIFSRAKELVANRTVTISALPDYAQDLVREELDFQGVDILTDATAQPDRLLEP